MKLTETEKIILQNTDKKWRYITRDAFGNLVLFVQQPAKYVEYGDWGPCGIDDNYDDDWIVFPFNSLFQCIQWTDEKAMQFRDNKC